MLRCAFRRMKIKFGDYGMVLVLLALVLLFSLLTLKRKDDNGPSAALDLVEQVQKDVPEGQTVLIFGATNTPYQGVAEGVAKGLTKEGRGNFQLVIGVPRDLRVALNELRGAGGQLGRSRITTPSSRTTRCSDPVPVSIQHFFKPEISWPSPSEWS